MAFGPIIVKIFYFGKLSITSSLQNPKASSQLPFFLANLQYHFLRAWKIPHDKTGSPGLALMKLSHKAFKSWWKSINLIPQSLRLLKAVFKSVRQWCWVRLRRRKLRDRDIIRKALLLSRPKCPELRVGH